MPPAASPPHEPTRAQRRSHPTRHTRRHICVASKSEFSGEAAGTLRNEVQRPWGKGGEAEAWINRIVVPTASFARRELGRKRASRAPLSEPDSGSRRRPPCERGHRQTGLS